MKVVLFGAEGMLGHDLAHVFADMQPRAVDRDQVDITDAEAVRTYLEEQRPDVILNAAAYTIVDQAETEHEAAFAVNEAGVRHIAEAARQVGAVVVHYSTDYVFSGDREDGYVEDDTPGPAVNLYGASKLAGEDVLRASGVRYYLVRTAWLYGHHGKNFVDTMLRLSAERREVQVVDDQYGSPTYTHDLALATRQLIEEDDYQSGVYHLVNEGIATWRTFAEEIFRIARRPMRVIPITSAEYPRPAQRPQYSVLKNTRGPKLHSWQVALAEYLKQR